MKHLVFVIFLTLFQPVFATSPVWLIESAHSRLYLAGTIHLLRESDYPLPTALDKAYTQSSILAFETDIAASQSPDFQQQLLQAVTLSTGVTLQQLLTPQTLSELETYLNDNNMQLLRLSGFKPVMVALTLTLHELGKLGVISNGVDQHFYNRAIRDGKITAALETSLQQIEFLSRMGEGQEDLMIKQTLQDLKTLKEQFSQMLYSWREGDTVEMEALFVEPMRSEFEPVYQQLLVQRNDNWMPQIMRMLETADTEMVLVGTAHLLGTDGLLFRLRQAGFKITQLD